MDVRCARCGTDYEFDDALISERGTTVKCTHCGHQFRVYPDAGVGGPERWIVRATDGRELVFTSLRELQRAISQGQVGPGDMLSRGLGPARPLQAIMELVPFFKNRGAVRTLYGVAPPANSPDDAKPNTSIDSGWDDSSFPPNRSAEDAYPGSRAPSVDPPTIPRELGPFSAVSTRFDGPASRAATDPIPSRGQQVRERSVTDPSPHFQRQRDPTPEIQGPIGRSLASTHPSASLEPGDGTSSASNRPSTPSRPSVPLPLRTEERNALPSYDDLEAESLAAGPLRRAQSRWIVGFVLLGVVVLLALTVGRRFIGGYAQTKQAAQPTSDARVGTMLERGTELLEQGDLEGAKEQFDKASVLSEKDPAVLSALARLETIRADQEWLKLRLLDPSRETEVEATHRLLGQRVGRAQAAVDAAFAVAAENPTVVRARIDLYRMRGEPEKARDWIEPISKNPADPQNAYVLGALDLSEDAPVWTSVIDRLRTAASTEKELNRARAALIYALTRAEQIEQAELELSKLAKQAKPHALWGPLKAFVARHAAPPDAGTDGEAKAAAVDLKTLPSLDTRVVAEEPAFTDFRAQLKRASEASSSGDLDTAKRLYNKVLETHPSNTEALAGLADIARRRGETTAAQNLYDRVLAQNPSYLPALMGSADQKWAGGDRTGAVKLYRRVVEQAGAGTGYGQRAQQRITEFEASAPSEPGSAPSPAREPSREPPGTAAEPAPVEPPADDQPHIDTTDLPEFNQ